MKITIQHDDKGELVASIFLINTPNLNKKLYETLSKIMKYWQLDVVLDDDLKNLLCEELEYITISKWQTLMTDINKLSTIHKEINGIASPLVIPNYERSKNRIIKLHPILEKVLLSPSTIITVEHTCR